MIEIVYTDNGKVVPDEQLEKWSEQVIKEHKNFGYLNIEVGSSIMVDMIRVLIVREKLKPEEVTFFNRNKEEPIKINSAGRLSDWPSNFCSKGNELLYELITACSKSKKEVSKNNLY